MDIIDENWGTLFGDMLLAWFNILKLEMRYVNDYRDPTAKTLVWTV